MRLVWISVVILAAVWVVTCDAASKKRKKFEGDFEFADDNADSDKGDGEKKTWIFDPDSELCQALKCRKEERCLLENAYTAVCVSRAEIRKNGDVVVPKGDSRSWSTTARSLDDDDDDDDKSDSDDYDDEEDEEEEEDALDGGAGDFSLNLNEENNVDGDLGLEFYDLDGGDKAEEGTSTTTTTTTTPPSAMLKRCNPCPVIKPTYVCGTDNNTYSSLCKLDYFNCMHDAIVKMACSGFCPCPSKILSKKEKQAMRLSHFESKYKATVGKGATLKPTVIFSPEVAKFKKEIFNKKAASSKAASKSASAANAAAQMDLSADKQRQRGYNDVLPDKKEAFPISECSDSGLSAMGNRLLDWFSVLMAQGGQAKAMKSVTKAHFPASCAKEVKWMFGNLDSNGDTQLSVQELYDLEHNERENCLKPFLDKCDDNRDIFVTSAEWCRCFEKADRPCVAMKRRSKPGLLGAYKPSCDVEGFFQPTQCHSAIGTCWCVNKHGVEQNGSRTRGKPDCEGILSKNGLMKNSLMDENDEDDAENRLDDSDELEEGSGDY